MTRNNDAVSNMDRDAIKRLEVWLAQQSGGRAQVRDLKQLSGGAIQENWKLVLNLDGGTWPGVHDLVSAQGRTIKCRRKPWPCRRICNLETCCRCRCHGANAVCVV